MKISINKQNKRKLREYYDSSKLDHNLHKGEIIYLRTGAVLYRDSDSVDSFFMVSSGKINLIKKKSLTDIRSLIIKPDQFFGIEEFTEDIPRISTAVALEDTLVVEIKEGNLKKLCGGTESPMEEISGDIWDRLDYSESTHKKQSREMTKQFGSETVLNSNTSDLTNTTSRKAVMLPDQPEELIKEELSTPSNDGLVDVIQYNPKLYSNSGKSSNESSVQMIEHRIKNKKEVPLINIKKYGDAVILAINSVHCTLDESGQVLSNVLEFIEKGEYNLIITLNKAETVDSTFKGMLITAAKKLNIRGNELKVVCNQKVFPDLMSTINSSITIEVYSDLFKAVANTGYKKEVA